MWQARGGAVSLSFMTSRKTARAEMRNRFGEHTAGSPGRLLRRRCSLSFADDIGGAPAKSAGDSPSDGSVPALGVSCESSVGCCVLQV